nr:MAG TPA: hypothetical protein [Caudoviricetes sp.]
MQRSISFCVLKIRYTMRHTTAFICSQLLMTVAMCQGKRKFFSSVSFISVSCTSFLCHTLTIYGNYHHL